MRDGSIQISQEDVQRLVAELLGAGGPLTAQVLAMRLWSSDTEGNRRRVRAIASAGRPRIVSFPGSNGYDLFERCSEADLKHGIASIRAQASSMACDANIYQAAFDARLKPTQAQLAL